MSEKSTALKGICFIFTETGLERGHLAFQDSRFITKDAVGPFCVKCGKYLAPQTFKELEITRATLVTEKNIADVIAGKEPPECPNGKHERIVQDAWSHKGLHLLEDGDHLTIFSPGNPKRAVWAGTIRAHEHLLPTGGVLDGFFLSEYTAELIPARTR